MTDIAAAPRPMADDSDMGIEGEMYYQSFDYQSPAARRRLPGASDIDEESLYKARKRPRGHHSYPRPANDDDEPPPVIVTANKKGIRVGNSEEIWAFYEQRFKNCQQTACKLIAKAWVKAVEPKKQSNHPYTGSDEKAPDWWPKPWGPTKDDKVRHKEPDHLYKRGKCGNIGGSEESHANLASHRTSAPPNPHSENDC
jgi:hypothetical protein